MILRTLSVDFWTEHLLQSRDEKANRAYVKFIDPSKPAGDNFIRGWIPLDALRWKQRIADVADHLQDVMIRNKVRPRQLLQTDFANRFTRPLPSFTTN
jgi:hypothetical protein